MGRKDGDMPDSLPTIPEGIVCLTSFKVLFISIAFQVKSRLEGVVVD
jgi:hypothetical protein